METGALGTNYVSSGFTLINGDFELPFNKKKAAITVPITIASAKRSPSMNDSNSGTNLGDINTGRLKYNEVFFNSIG